MYDTCRRCIFGDRLYDNAQMTEGAAVRMLLLMQAAFESAARGRFQGRAHGR